MEKFELENFPVSESAKKMLSYVSDGFYDESYVGKWIFQVMGIEYDKALEIVTDLPAQFFPETATWGLMYHEVKWGLPIRLNLSYEERRRLIYQKRDYRAPMTPYRMERYLEDATGFEVHIADVNVPGEYGFLAAHPNAFKAYFLGDGTLDCNLVFGVLDRLKQSHTVYTVNDRVEIGLDNKELEQITVRNIQFRLPMLFWDCHVFNGAQCFDGSILFNNVRKQIKVSLKIGSIAAVHKEEVKFFSGFSFPVYNQPECNLFVKEAVSIKEPVGSFRIGSTVKAGILQKEEMEVTVILKRNAWFFDGAYRFDGERFFNAEIRKEEL